MGGDGGEVTTVQRKCGRRYGLPPCKDTSVRYLEGDDLEDVYSDRDLQGDGGEGDGGEVTTVQRKCGRRYGLPPCKDTSVRYLEGDDLEDVYSDRDLQGDG